MSATERDATPWLSIGALADAADVSVETIRFYQRKGLLAEPQRPLGGFRRYDEHALGRVRFVKAAQRIGFSLDEIGELLNLEDGTRCAQARRVATQKLIEVRARLSDLQRMEAALSELVGRCETARGTVSCPLIEALQQT
ncbi:MAG: Hg(II)-responsive transcriptional regulator [Methylibium sp.]